jgi:hypothetical protein
MDQPDLKLAADRFLVPAKFPIAVARKTHPCSPEPARESTHDANSERFKREC